MATKKKKAKTPLSPKDKQQVDARLRKARERLKAAHEAKDKVKARQARGVVRRTKRDQRRISQMVAVEAAVAAAEAKAAATAATE